MEFCKEHTRVITDLAEIKADVKAVRNDLQELNRRINGSLDRMARHIEDGEQWRRKISNNKAMIKILMWIVGIVNFAIFVFITKALLQGAIKFNV